MYWVRCGSPIGLRNLSDDGVISFFITYSGGSREKARWFICAAGMGGEDRGCGATRPYIHVYLTINVMPRATYITSSTMRTKLCCRSVKAERGELRRGKVQGRPYMFSAGFRSTTQGNSVEPSSLFPRNSIPNIHTSCLNPYNLRTC